MKLSVILISFLIAFSFLNQSFAEVYTTGSAADNNGNIFFVGRCAGNIILVNQQFSLTSPSCFLLKLNSDGELIWVKFYSSSVSVSANAVAIDSAGNLYVTGEFSGTANFGNETLTTQETDFFVLKSDSLGNLIWVKKGWGLRKDKSNDIIVLNSDNIFLCGNTNFALSFDSFTIGSGGFILKIDSNGNGLALFNSGENAMSLNLDKDFDLIVGGIGNSGYPFYDEFSIIIKYDSCANILWQKPEYLGGIVSTTIGFNSEVYTANSFNPISNVYLKKYDPYGIILSTSQFSTSFINDFDSSGFDDLIIQGFYENNSVIGDSILISSGLEDAFIAKLDTGFNVIWIKHAGGSFKDEMRKIIALNDGSILATAHFKGTINFDTLQFSGGTAPDDQWLALLKFDSDGNLLWFKKIGENYIEPSTKIWFPTNIGNNWQYLDFKRYYPITYEYSFVNISITASSIINSTTYYQATNFFNFPSNTLFRYDIQTQRLLILQSGIEYTFIDFSKSEGETYLQIQPDNSFLTVLATEGSVEILGDTVLTKGFYRETNQIYGYYNFAENYGLINQDEERILLYTLQHDYNIIEYVVYNPEYTHHKHQYVPSLDYQPIFFIPDANYLNQNFQINHQFSILTNSPSYIYGRCYIKNAYLQSFYYNGIDTIWNNNFNIPQTTEIDFSLNYQFDTTKYNQGYHLYYRIAAVDKGIVADTFYSPQTGYYKLFWRDSTTSVIQTEFEALTYSLSQNYPNPFNPVSRIVFTIPKRENVSLKVYDILGSEITTLVNKELDAGKYEVDFSGKELSSGIYIYQIKAGAFRETKKMILMR